MPVKIQIASDLHSEFYGSEDWDALLAQFKGEADILVLAGDIVQLRFLDQIRQVLQQFCDKYKHVVFVPGNHEFYGTDVALARDVLGHAALGLDNLVVLWNSEEDVGGVKFYGGTMWFKNLPNNWKWKHELNDFRYIRRFEPWVYEQEKEFVQGLMKTVTPAHVVVTHHLPSFGSSPECYRQQGMNSLNAFFIDVLDWEIAMVQPQLWIHGHTHTACDYNIGKTRVLCNPFGYPYEMADFPPEVIVEI